MHTQSEILAKLARLKALRNNPGSEGEAAAAAAAVSRLLLIHNLAEAEIPDTEDDGPEPFVCEDFDVYFERHVDEVSWRAALLATLAKYHFCKVATTPRTSRNMNKTFSLIGRPANIAALRDVFDTIANQIAVQAELAWKVARQQNAPRRRFTRSFRLGAVVTIGERFAAQRRSDLDETRNAHALVLMIERDLDGAVRDLIGQTRNRQLTPRVSHDGYTCGRAAGHSVKIQNEVGATGRALNAGRLALGRAS